MAKVIVREHNEDFKVIELEGDIITLEQKQQIVQGRIELCTLIPKLEQQNIDIWLNEEGKLNGLPPTILVFKSGTDEILELFYGNILFTSYDGKGNTIGLNDIQIQTVKKLFKKCAVLTDGSIVNTTEV